MITGGCLCGAVRFRATEGPIAARICWCRDCQKLGAGGPAVSAAFKTASVTIAGALSDYASTADSGNKMHRRFCSKCGSHLFSEAEVRPHLIFIRVGALDDPTVAKPGATIWTDSAPSWASIDPNLPNFKKQPPPVA